MQILESARTLLESSEYVTTTVGAGEDQFIFENANLYGVVALLSPGRMAEEWQEIQDAFIRQQSATLARVPEKAWNVYLVMLSEETPLNSLARRLAVIEEDFRGARKIARTGIRTRDTLEMALAPLLPLKYARPVSAIDVEQRVKADPGISRRILELLEAEMEPEAIASELLQ